VINSEDLIAHGTHLKWCFDVWEHEPQIDKQILEQALIATPHIAGYSVQSKIRGIDMIYRIACAKKIIVPSEQNPIAIPTQILRFAGTTHHWQDLALGIFNPLVMTAIMRTTLLNAENAAALFDQLRNQFNYRHEFSATKIAGINLSLDDSRICAKLGMNLNS
jgi:erythronate-4-phosphate dehydrogenase